MRLQSFILSGLLLVGVVLFTPLVGNAQSSPRTRTNTPAVTGLRSAQGGTPAAKTGGAKGSEAPATTYRNQPAPASNAEQQRINLGQKAKDAGLSLPGNFYTMSDAEAKTWMENASDQQANRKKNLREPAANTDEPSDKPAETVDDIQESDFKTYNPEKQQHILGHPEKYRIISDSGNNN